MIYIIMWLISIILLSAEILSFYREEINIIKLLTLSSGAFITLYILTSSVLLYLDKFSVGRVMTYMLLLEFCICLLCFAFCGIPKWEFIDWDLKKYVFLLAVFIVVLLVTALKSVPVAPMFDAGCYVSKALQLTGDNPTAVVNLQEYTLIPDETAQEELLELQNNQVGIYEKDRDNMIYNYEYHGLPTWPAVLALSAACFGTENISLILSFLLVIVISSLYLVMDNLSIDRWHSNLGIIIFAVSPLVLYLYKLPLSEGLITCLFAFCLFAISEKNRTVRCMAGFSMGALCFSHISLFMYFPVLYGCILLLYLREKDSSYAITNILFSVCFVLSLVYAVKVSYIYLRGNLDNRIEGVGAKELVLLIVFMAAVCMLLQFIICRLVVCCTNMDLYAWLEKKAVFLLKILLGLSLLYTIYDGYVIGFTDKLATGEGSWRFRELYANQGLMSIARLNIVNIAMAVGWILLPLVMIHFLKTKKLNVWQICFNGIWIYALAIYTFVRMDTPINYSASRYFLIILIPAVILAGAHIIKSRKQLLLAAIAAVIVSIPFNIPLLLT